MNRTLASRAVLAAALIGLAACSDGERLLSPEAPASSPTPALMELACTGSISSHAVKCGTPAAGGPSRTLMVGGQGTYLQLTSSNVAVQADTFQFDVTVQNLIPQSLGTTDGATLDPAGVRVFFSVLPTTTVGTGSISVANADGEGAFTAPNQPYYQYDEVIPHDAVSAPKTWKLQFDPAVDQFAFKVYVATEVQYPQGYVTVAAPGAFQLTGASQALSATVMNVVGDTLTDPVTWSSSDPAIATVDASGNVTGVAPGNVSIIATSGSRVGSAAISVCPDLAVGGTYVATMPGAADLCFGGGGAAEEFTYMPVNLSSSSALSLSVTATGIQAVTGPPSPDRAPAGLPLLSLASQGGSLTSYEPAILAQGQLQGDSKIAAARAARATRTTTGIRRSITPGVPTVGDLMSLNVAQGCSGTPDLRTGQVRSVGTYVVIVSDTANPAGGFTTAQYDSIKLEFDTLAYPVVSSNFGAATDVDSNGRIVLFYTRAVNELSPPATALGSTDYGYFTNRDVFSTDPVSGCERSNAGEILYMLVPDPTGAVNSNVRTVSAVRGNTIRQSAHDLQHLINAFRRVYVTGATAFEETWLDEGLSRVAEELMFYRTAPGLAPRQNIVLSSLNTGPSASRRVAAYNTYQNPNFTNFRQWLQRPDTTGAFRTNKPTSTGFQGVIWAFLRYSADRVGGTEATFWQSLVNSNLEGKANLQNAFGADPDGWLRDFVAAMYADDVAGITMAAPYTTPSWNYRSVYGGLGGFPLLARPLTDSSPLTLSYSFGGGTAYTRFGVPAAGYARVTALSGGVVPSSPYSLIVVRTK